MGFLSAVREIGQMEGNTDIERQLKFPLDTEGGMIRVFMKVPDVNATPLHVEGVEKVDVVDFKRDPGMKRKYLWKNRVGSNVFWGFTPIYKSGKPKAKERKEAFVGKDGKWTDDEKCHVFKIKAKVLHDYEAEGAFSKGSVDRIMQTFPSLLAKQLESLENGKSYIVIFGVGDSTGEFIYPGDIPAFVKYFWDKFEKKVGARNGEDEVAGGSTRKCCLCGRESSNTTTLDKVFKFSTFDKVSMLPGLDRLLKSSVFPICMDCHAELNSGRAYIERHLTNVSTMGGIRIWAVPEKVGNGKSENFRRAVNNLAVHISRDRIGSPGEEAEGRYFHKIAKEGQGLVFHFLFWEQNNSQELVHLMIEDVPPERLAFLESSWKKAVCVIDPDLEEKVDLDSCIRSLYKTLYSLAGKSKTKGRRNASSDLGPRGDSEDKRKSERIVMSSFALKILGHLLSGTETPIDAFKQVVVSRIPGLMHQTETWPEVRTTLQFATALIEFMSIVNARA